MLDETQMSPAEKMIRMNRNATIMGNKFVDWNQSEEEDKLNYAETFAKMKGTSMESVLGESARKLHDTLIDQLMVLSDTEKESIATKYPKLVEHSNDLKAQIEHQASVSGKEKIKTDFFGSKRRSARARLDKIKRDTRENDSLEIQEKTDNMQQTYWAKYRSRLSANGKHLGEAKDSRNPMAVFMNYQFNEKEENRRYIAKKAGDKRPDDFIMDKVTVEKEPVSFPGPGGSVLKGHHFTPPRDPDGHFASNGKVIILFTGSGQAGIMEAGMGETIEQYIQAGYEVFQVDYRGYGESGVQKKNGKVATHKITEKRFYEDGDAIYEGVKNLTGKNANDIILHGYSMGAAIASHVAANLAQKNAEDPDYIRTGNMEQTKKLGGLVLDSPMSSMKYAATYFAGEKAGNLAEKYAGKYSTDDHLEVLHQFQPDIPVLYVGGGEDDHLSLNKTKIDDHEKFKNSGINVEDDKDHFACHMNVNKLNDVLQGADNDAN